MGAEIAAAVQGSMLPCTAMVTTTLCRHTQSSGHSLSSGRCRLHRLSKIARCHPRSCSFERRRSFRQLYVRVSVGIQVPQERSCPRTYGRRLLVAVEFTPAGVQALKVPHVRPG